jgi:hypothetical protein
MTDERPALSVVLMVDRQRARGAMALASILEQDVIRQIEVLLFELATGDTTPLPGADHPSVRVIPYPRGRSFGRARADSVRLARAPIVAFVEEHCVVFRGWARALIAAFQGPYAGVGGEVHTGNPGQGISDAVALVNYLPLAPPARRGESMLLPGSNSAYRRDVLLGYEDRLHLFLDTEWLLHWQLRRDGHRLLVDPAVKFAHLNETRFRSLAVAAFLANRLSAPRRVRLFHWSEARIALYFWLTPLIPWVRLGRMLWSLTAHRPRHFRDAVRYAPIILATQVVGVAGQAVGLLAGVGDADARFFDYELNEDRALAGSARYRDGQQ